MAETYEPLDSAAAPAPRWREDFPIAWDNDHYVTRRDLIKFLTLGSALLVGANAAIAALGRRWRPRPFPSRRILLVIRLPCLSIWPWSPPLSSGVAVSLAVKLKPLD